MVWCAIMNAMLGDMTAFINVPRVRMVIAGAISVALSYAVFLLLISLGVHYMIASIANFFTYLTVNFILNRTWAFKSTGNVRSQALSHISLHLGNQIFILVGLYVLVELLAVQAAWSQIIMQIIVTLAVFLITPLIFKNR
jgi:putative flippase GtrA